MDIDIMNQKPKHNHTGALILIGVIAVTLLIMLALAVTVDTYPEPPVIITVPSEPLPDTSQDEINKAIQDEQFKRAFNTFKECMLDTNHKQTAEECKQQFWNTPR